MFTEKSFQFLQDLQKNNKKEWFEENREKYNKHLLSPTKELVDKLEMFILNIDENLITKPVINKAISRIFRDVRFSRSKLPFKDNLGFNFKKPLSSWKYYPSFMFRIFPQGYYFGLSISKNDPEKFSKIREAIDLDEKKFSQIIKKIESNKDLEVRGEDYKKYKFSGKDKKIQKYYSKKKLHIICFQDANKYKTEEELVLDLRKKFESLAPLYIFINQSLLKKTS
jgi:uncharacterized protein (TIGR02453 family)